MMVVPIATALVWIPERYNDPQLRRFYRRNALPHDSGRGEVWLADLNPTRGHEQAGKRPVAVVSEDRLNNGPAGLVIVLPITSTIRPIPSHVVVAPPEGGLAVRSAVI
jgi:mRNA interferase MazF